MYRLGVVVLAVLVTLITATALPAANKITVDPNAGKADTVLTTDPAPDDTALKQKISYESGSKRLYGVADDLAAMTGLKISAGENKNQWQIRDLPLAVYVKDMPLSKLLERIAICTHTKLQFRRTKEDGLIIRFVEDPDVDLNYRKMKNLEGAAWMWDALVAYSDYSDQTHKLQESDPDSRVDRTVGKLLKALEPDVKARVLAGEEIILNGETSPQASLLRDLYVARVQRGADRNGSTAINSSSARVAADAQQSYLSIKVVDGSHYSMPCIYLSGFPVISEETIGCSRYKIAVDAATFFDWPKELKLPPIPDPPNPCPVCDTKQDTEGSPLKFLSTDEDWKQPTLQKKVKLQLDTSKDKITDSEICSALSKACGYNIICEDFPSVDSEVSKIVNLTTLGEVLKAIPLMWWSINEDEKLIIGWRVLWRNSHLNLVPESLVSELTDKANGAGIQLDDVSKIASLAIGQICEWFRSSKDLQSFNMWEVKNQAFWVTYGALKPEDKALAKSDAGLPLVKLDPQWLRNTLGEYNHADEGFCQPALYRDEVEKDRIINQGLAKMLIYTDPELMANTTMRIKPGNIAYPNMRIQSGLDQRFYHMELDCGPKYDSFILQILGPDTPFPIYSPKREAELREAKQKDTASK